jgi:sorting nexin-25
MPCRKLIGRLRDALDQEQTALPSRGHASGTSSPWQTILGKSAAKSTRQTDKKSRSFASFLASIETMNVLDARRTRSDLVQQIRKTQGLLDAASPGTAQQAALRRLQTAVSTVDARLALLGVDQAEDGSDKLAAAAPGAAVSSSSVQLRDILRSPSAISHFLEWMERKQRGMLPQFWLSVDMFKGPLEDVESDSEDEGDAAASGNAAPREVQALREDLRLFADHYFGSERLSISQRHIDVVRRFLDTSPEAPTSRRAVHVLRQSVLKAQREIEGEMLEDDWPAFRQSAGFFSAVDDLAREKQAVVGSPAPASPDEAVFPDGVLQAGTPKIRSRAALAAVPFASASPLAAGGRSALVGDAEEGTHSPRLRSGQLRAPAMTQKLDLLIGGAGTTRGSSGRAPLFQEALFGEEDAVSEDEAAEENAGETLRADRMDALQHALSSIIDEDGQPSLDPARQRVAAGSRPARPLSVASSDSGARSPVPGPSRRVSEATVSAKARFATAKRDLRPAFKRSGTSGGDEEHSHRRLAVFGDDTQESPTQAATVSLEDDVAELHPIRAQTARPSLDYGAELARVDAEIARLNGQLELLDALVRKAELTGASAKETRLLQKSHSTVARELREHCWERTQIAERDAQSALLPGRTEVSIAQTSVGHEQDGKDYVQYIIEVIWLAADEPGEDAESRVQSGHAVSRRYAEFHALHVRLRERVRYATFVRLCGADLRTLSCLKSARWSLCSPASGSWASCTRRLSTAGGSR